MALFDLIVVGGGAAGFYGAIHAARLRPDLKILILEKSGKLLSKVRISGGGRCNVTHACFDFARFSKHYPRGARFLKAVFRQHGARETVDWFASCGVRLKQEDDGRMFPVTDNSETIVHCLLSEARKVNIQIETGKAVEKLKDNKGNFQLVTAGRIVTAKKVLVAVGGGPTARAYEFLKETGHTVRGPIPSLFTFNDPKRKFADLMGLSVADAEVKIAGTKLKMQGPVLITHWGLSGPAVIRLSAWAAEYLHEVNYTFTALVSWLPPTPEEEVRTFLQKQKQTHPKQKVVANSLFGLPQRLWARLCAFAGLPDDKVWGEMGMRQINKLVEQLIRCGIEIKGKTTFKDEFVTCGGIPLDEVDESTMESNLIKGLYFAGEVLDIDGETGGFNFQAAWSTGFLAAKSISAGYP